MATTHSPHTPTATTATPATTNIFWCCTHSNLCSAQPPICPQSAPSSPHQSNTKHTHTRQFQSDRAHPSSARPHFPVGSAYRPRRRSQTSSQHHRPTRCNTGVQHRQHLEKSNRQVHSTRGTSPRPRRLARDAPVAPSRTRPNRRRTPRPGTVPPTTPIDRPDSPTNPVKNLIPRSSTGSEGSHDQLPLLSRQHQGTDP